MSTLIYAKNRAECKAIGRTEFGKTQRMIVLLVAVLKHAGLLFVDILFVNKFA